MTNKPGLDISYIKKGLFKTLLLGMLLLQPIIGWSQETDSANKVAESTWTTPEIIGLPVNWWSNFFTEDTETFRSRADLLITRLNEYISRLDADNLVAAQTSVKTLKTNLDAVLALQRASPAAGNQTLPTYDVYSMQQLFELRTLLRDGKTQMDVLVLEQQQMRQRNQLLMQRRDLNFAQYIKADPLSPARLLTGLSRINARLELYLLSKKLEANTVQQTRLKSYQDDVVQKIKYASKRLSVDELSVTKADSSIQGLSDELTKATRKLTVAQQELIDATKADTPDLYNILNLKQQLTLASAEELLFQLKLELERTIRDWVLLRSGTATSIADLRKSDPLLDAIINGVEQQTALWTDASQNTLVTPAPAEGRTAKRAYDEAQTNAHGALSHIADINTTMDNLTLASEQVSTETLALEQGLSGVGLRIKLFVQELWTKTKSTVNISLFHIGEQPVTTGSFVRALLIFLFFLTISWLIRKFLDRLERRKHFQQGSFYAGGRVLHYVILTIAIMAALGSIGLNFGSFALIAGALSVGIGFGLQSVVLNFVSGLILLFEGSIRVGDYVQLESGDAGPGLLGVVREIRSRATLINTNNNIDVIVPNSELVGNRMINWTLKESIARMRIPFSVAYGSDKDLVQKAALEAAQEGEYCIHNTPGHHPAVRMMGFGDSALNFELRVWVNRQGIRRPVFVSSSIYWALDDKFREYGIEVPFPQRDIHINTEPVLMDSEEITETD